MYKIDLGRKVILGIALALIVGTAAVASADSPTPWLNDSLTIKNEGDLPSASHIPPSINSNRDCKYHNFVTRPKSAVQSEISHNACAVQTLYGLVDTNGWLEFNGTGTSGKLINYPGYSIGLVPVPNSKILINYFSTGVGAQLYINQNLPPAIIASTAVSGEVTYKINSPAQISLRDRSNSVLLTQLDTISFSANGKWMVVDAKNRAILRVNLDTFDILPFAPSFNYNIGLDPSVKTAITSNGRYAVVYSKNIPTFKIYDLQTCGPVPNNINAPVQCQSKDLLPIAQQQISGLNTISRIRFIDDENIIFYASYQPAGLPIKIAKFRLTSGETSASEIELLALGDSYISGEGTFEYKSGTDTENNKCHLSLISYPFLASSNAGLNSYQSVSCSGAKIPDILNDSYSYEGQVKDGLTREERQVEDILQAFKNGYINQSEFVKKYWPKNILISIGGNDIGFSDILKRCLEPDTCFSTYEDRLELALMINNQFNELVDTYTKIKEEGTPNSKIFVMGYPQIALPDGNCAVNVRLSNQELYFSTYLTEYLNATIKLAADKAGAIYIDNEQALNGYKLCETTSNNVAVNGLTAGNDTPIFLNGPIGNESYHPNKLGHELLSYNFLQKSANLNAQMPTSTTSLTPLDPANYKIVDAPKTNRQINRINFDDDLTNSMVYRETWWNLIINGAKYSLLPSSPISLVLHSDPIELGNFSADVTGGLEAQFKLPADTPVGFHTIHAMGNNMAGENVDIFKTIYVANNEVDYDGDELLNSLDSCPTFENSGIDFDKDGVDDNCDEFIAEAPTTSDTGVSEQTNSSQKTKPNHGPSSMQPAATINGNRTLSSTGLADSDVQAASHNDELVLGEQISSEPNLENKALAGANNNRAGAGLAGILPLLGDETSPEIIQALLAGIIGFGLVYLRRLYANTM